MIRGKFYISDWPVKSKDQSNPVETKPEKEKPIVYRVKGKVK